MRKLKEGGVEVICEGKEPALKEFLQKIDNVFEQYIRDVDINWGKATGEFSDFNIRF